MTCPRCSLHVNKLPSKRKGCSVQTFLHCYSLALFLQRGGELCVRLKLHDNSAACFYQPSGKKKTKKTDFNSVYSEMEIAGPQVIPIY